MGVLVGVAAGEQGASGIGVEVAVGRQTDHGSGVVVAVGTGWDVTQLTNSRAIPVISSHKNRLIRVCMVRPRNNDKKGLAEPFIAFLQNRPEFGMD